MTYLHKFKCMTCGLHFIVCSWYEDWPNAGNTFNDERFDCVYCPECGKTTIKLKWKEKSNEMISNFVPGKATSTDFIKEVK